MVFEQDGFSHIQKFDWGSILWLIEPKEDSSRVSVGLVTFYPHMRQEEHSHIREEQVVYVISGHGSHWVDGVHSKLAPGTYTHLPPHSRHELTNESDEDLRLLIVYTPSKIHKLLPPLGEYSAQSAQEGQVQPFFDMDTIGPILHTLSQALGLSLALVDPTGKCILKTENHPAMCSHLADVTNGAYCQKHLNRVFREITNYNKPYFFFCCCNIASIIIPVAYMGTIHGYLKCGELFLTKSDKEKLVEMVPEIAARYGVEEGFLYNAVGDLPIEPKSRLHTAAEATFAIANTLVAMTASSFKQNELNSSRLSLVREQLASAKLEKTLHEYWLKLLQSQVNPHFLFNTLNTIAQMAYIEGAKKTSELTCNLSELLRYTLRKTEQLIPLDEELALL
ncbi:MAG: PocR ligand-binding domain-containing protein, partial [Candidatus Adiutrix sp.]